MASTIDHFLSGQRERGPELIVGIGKMKSRRHDPYDFVGLVIQKNLVAQDARISGKAASPQAVAYQQDLRVTGVILFGSKNAAESRVDSERREESGRDKFAFEPQRFARTRDVEAAIAIRRHTLENGVLSGPVGEISRRGSVPFVLISGKLDVFVH